MLRVAAQNLGFDFDPISTSNFRFERKPTGQAEKNRFSVTQGFVGKILDKDMQLRKLFLAEQRFDSAVMVAGPDAPKDVHLYFMANDTVFKVSDDVNGEPKCQKQNAGIAALPKRAAEEIASMKAAPGCGLALVVAPGFEDRPNFRRAMQRASETIQEILLKQSPAPVRAVAEQAIGPRPAVAELAPA
jgi:hypothetical protein